MNQLVFINNGQAVTDSLTVAEVFGKEHKNVVRDIEIQIAKLVDANEGEWGVLNFELTQYQHPQNKQFYPKYNLTEDAFAIVAMSYVTPAAMKMKVKFLEEFKRMREQLTTPQLSGAELIAAIANQAVEQEKRVKALEAAQQQQAEQIDTIKETFLHRDEDWRKYINDSLNKAAHRMGGKYQELRNRSYKMLAERARCKLDVRLNYLLERLERQGATNTQLRKTSKLDVIKADPKLKEIYTTIVKELSIGTMV